MEALLKPPIPFASLSTFPNSLFDQQALAPRPDGIEVSTWLAKAMLQKAIRRGDTGFALGAASRLLELAPDQLWRRLAGLAVEDVGFGNWSLVASIVELARSKRSRKAEGDEWQVVALAVERLCPSAKCRACDDLLLVSQRHPGLAGFRMQVRTWDENRLLRFCSGQGSAMERAIAALCFLQSQALNPRWAVSRQRADQMFRAFSDNGLTAEVVTVADRSFRRTREVLAFMACILGTIVPKDQVLVDDPLKPTALINGVPNWAFDMFSHEGRAALALFLSFDCATARRIRAVVPVNRQIQVLGHLLFRVEGQLCKQRRQWQQAKDLRRMMDYECHGPYLPEASDILAMLTNDLPLLNLARFEAHNG